MIGPDSHMPAPLYFRPMNPSRTRFLTLFSLAVLGVISGLIPATAVMVYAPRDAAEVDVVAALLVASYRFAGGRLAS